VPVHVFSIDNRPTIMRMQLICIALTMPALAQQALAAQCPAGPSGWRNDTDFKVRADYSRIFCSHLLSCIACAQLGGMSASPLAADELPPACCCCCLLLAPPLLLLLLRIRQGDDLSPPLKGVKTAEECCAKCSSTPGCNAMSFGPLPSFGCRLKKGVGKPAHFKDRVSFFLDRHSPPPHPHPPPPPPGPPITEVHVVFSNHFDAGCKTPGCNNVSTEPDFMWPIGCATTLHGPGQPHAYHIINRYFDEFFPLASDEQSNASSFCHSITITTTRHDDISRVPGRRPISATSGALAAALRRTTASSG
jgi:hypothetical protein